MLVFKIVVIPVNRIKPAGRNPPHRPPHISLPPPPEVDDVKLIEVPAVTYSIAFTGFTNDTFGSAEQAGGFL